MIPTGRVLVIDDEEGIRRGVQRVLAGDGHDVCLAADGQSGVEVFSEVGSKGGFDLVLVDLRMPGSLDGLGVIREVMSRDPDVIAIVFSAYATLDAAVQATRLGAYDFLAKPFSPDELRVAVRKGLERRFLILEHRRLVEERERNLLLLSKERGRLRNVINSMDDGVLVINQKGMVVYANPVVRMMLRLSLDNPVGMDYRESLAGTELGPHLDALLAEPEASPRRISHEFDLDEQTTIMAHLNRLMGENDQPQGCVLVLRDISRLKQLDRTKSRFVSVVSHELKAPLAAIEGYLGVILDGMAGEMSEKARTMLDRCKGRAETLQGLINDILNITSMEAGTVTRNLQHHDVAEVIAGVIELLSSTAQARGLEIIQRHESGLPPLLVDRDDLERLLVNLISNAIKYNREEGRVTVSSYLGSDGLCLKVEDTGIGIAPDQIRHIGQEFYRVRSAATAKISGTGLGLSIVSKLMDFYRGVLRVDSTPGEGSTFTLVFPLPPGQSAGRGSQTPVEAAE